MAAEQFEKDTATASETGAFTFRGYNFKKPKVEYVPTIPDRPSGKNKDEESAARAHALVEDLFAEVTATMEAERKAAEEARAEAERRAAEEARAEAERRAAEEARAEAERKAAEEARLAELRAEAERKEAEEALAGAAHIDKTAHAWQDDAAPESGASQQEQSVSEDSAIQSAEQNPLDEQVLSAPAEGATTATEQAAEAPVKPAASEVSADAESPADKSASKPAAYVPAHFAAVPKSRPKTAATHKHASAPKPKSEPKPEPVTVSEPAAASEPAPVPMPAPAPKPALVPAQQPAPKPAPGPKPAPALAPAPAEELDPDKTIVLDDTLRKNRDAHQRLHVSTAPASPLSSTDTATDLSTRGERMGFFATIGAFVRRLLGLDEL